MREHVTCTRAFAAVVAALAVTTSVQAQNVRQMEGVASGTTMLMRDGRYNSCGLRFIGVDRDSVPPRFPYFAWDFNLAVMAYEGRQIITVLKTEMRKFDAAKDEPLGRLVKVKETWVQVEGYEPWKPQKTAIEGENSLSSMTVYDSDDVIKFMIELAGGKRDDSAILAIGLQGDGSTRYFRFKPKLNAADATSFYNCMTAVIAQAQKEVEKR